MTPARPGSDHRQLDDIEEILVADTHRLFTLADALVRDGTAVTNCIDGCAKTALGVTSLKNFCQFVDPLFGNTF